MTVVIHKSCSLFEALVLERIRQHPVQGEAEGENSNAVLWRLLRWYASPLPPTFGTIKLFLVRSAFVVVSS